jgi:dTDP-4-amino-4,6-dideoxygalactose transaminase
MSVSDVDRHSSDRVAREQYLEVGYNYRLTDIQAAVGIAQLTRLPTMLEARRLRASWYDDMLSDIPWIGTPPVPADRTWNVQTYTVRLENSDSARRDRVMQTMLSDGIATRPGVMTAHREPAYQSQGVSLPASEKASDGSMAIPLLNDLTEAEAERVVESLVRASRSGPR